MTYKSLMFGCLAATLLVACGGRSIKYQTTTIHYEKMPTARSLDEKTYALKLPDWCPPLEVPSMTPADMESADLILELVSSGQVEITNPVIGYDTPSIRAHGQMPIDPTTGKTLDTTRNDVARRLGLPGRCYPGPVVAMVPRVAHGTAKLDAAFYYKNRKVGERWEGPRLSQEEEIAIGRGKVMFSNGTLDYGDTLNYNERYVLVDRVQADVNRLTGMRDTQGSRQVAQAYELVANELRSKMPARLIQRFKSILSEFFEYGPAEKRFDVTVMGPEPVFVSLAGRLTAISKETDKEARQAQTNALMAELQTILSEPKIGKRQQAGVLYAQALTRLAGWNLLEAMELITKADALNREEKDGMFGSSGQDLQGRITYTLEFIRTAIRGERAQGRLPKEG